MSIDLAVHDGGKITVQPKTPIRDRDGFPGFFRGLLDARAREVNDAMKLAAAAGIAAIIPPSELRTDHVIPSPFDRRVVPAVAAAVARAAGTSGAG